MAYEWRKRNPDKWKAVCKRHYEKRGRETKRLWYYTEKGQSLAKRHNVSPKTKARRRAYEQTPQVKAYRKAYKAQAHRLKRERELRKRPEKRAQHREQQRKKRESIQTQLHNAMSCRIRTFVVKGRVSWPDLVGYTTDELKLHLEKQFHKRMTWSNYGKYGWHIDHIVPVSHFKFSSVEDPDFKACWALSNLRPLWSRENYKKTDKRTHLI